MRILVLILVIIALLDSAQGKPGAKNRKALRLKTCEYKPTLHGGTDDIQASYASKVEQLGRAARTPLDSGPRKLEHETFNGGGVVFQFNVERSPKKSASLGEQPLRVWKSTNITGEGVKKNINGTSLLISGFMPSHGSYFIHDFLPIFAYYKHHPKLQATTNYVMLNTSVAQNILSWLDPDFEKQVVYVRPKIVSRVKGGRTYVVNASSHVHNVNSFHMVKKWVNKMHAPSTAAPKIVYCAAAGGADPSLLTSDVEDSVLEALKEAMKTHERAEELVVYRAHSSTLSMQETFDLFSSAKVVVGAHSAALANILWMNGDMEKDCEKRPQVLELVDPTLKTHWNIMGTAPWVRYHHVRVSSAEGADVFKPDPGHLKAAFDAVLHK